MAVNAAKLIDKVLHRYRVSDITPILSPTEDNFFYCQNNKKQSYIGACFMAVPLNGLDETSFNLLVGAISVKLPADTIVQFSSLATNHVDDGLNHYQSQKIRAINGNSRITASQKENLISILSNRVEALKEATRVSPVKSSDVTLRDNRLLISIKVPADLYLSEFDLERAKEQILTIFDGLKTTVIADLRQLGKEEYIAQVRSYLYPFEPYDFVYDEFQKVSEQIFQKTTTIDNSDPNFCKIDDTYYSVLSVKALPKTNTIALMNQMAGDPLGSARQVSCPFLINCTIIIPDTEKANGSIELHYMQTDDAATPFALKMSPKLRDRRDGLQLMFNETKRGEVPCQLFFNVILFHKDRHKLNRIGALLVNYYKTQGIIMIPDSKIVLPLLWNAIPMYPSIESLKNTSRTSTMTIKQAATFIPLFSDFQNMRENFSQIYYTRRGNLYGFDPMMGQNHNGMIFGSSGGGKSVTTNNFVLQEFESGALIRIIDEGRSYKKICSVLGGTFIEFTNTSNVCLNPFTLVENINEELDQLTRIVKQMASPSTPLNDYVTSAIKRAIISSFNVGAKRTTISDVARFLEDQPEDEIRRIGRQLYDYTERGAYAKYFDGENNLNLNNQLVVLELEGLKQYDDLKTVVMMLLLSRIQTDMYFNTTYARKFVFFEEVTAYLNKEVVAEFISDFYARLRKYRAGVWLVTQNIESIASSPSISKIINNANYIVYLPYKSTEIDSMVQKNLIKNEPYIINTLKSLRLLPGQYSEAVILETDTQNLSTVRIVLNESEKILFSSTGETFIEFLQRLDAGEPVAEILEYFLNQKARANQPAHSVNDRDMEHLAQQIRQGGNLEELLTQYKRNIMNKSTVE